MFLFTSPASQTQGADAPYATAMRQASERTGVSFDYLLATARRESGLRADAQAATSSARGLYQFIDQTWLRLMREEGAALGQGAAAAAIGLDASGRAVVADPAARQAILKLRDDPALSAAMAAALARNNGAALEGALGRPASEGELYLAHFLGAAGAARLIRMAAATPAAAAASAFPAQAEANRSIFYGRDGAARSAQEVYRRLTGGFGETAGVTATAAAQPEAGSLFHRLFGVRVQTKVAPNVAALWGRAPAPGQPIELNLFRVVRS